MARKSTDGPQPVAKPKADRKKVPIPENLRKPITLKSLTGHNYQRKLAAHFAPHLLPEALQALYDGIQAGNMTAISRVIEMYELITKSSAVSIINNNNVDNRSLKIEGSSAEVSEGRRSFETAMRLMTEERERRARLESPSMIPTTLDITFADTPEGVSK